MKKIGIIGMGGFAADHHMGIYGLEKKGLCKLVCTCDPNQESFVEMKKEYDLVGRGVDILSDYKEMLAKYKDELDIITIPTPLPLHAQMHKDCVEAGLAVYLEKPPTLYYKELEEMIAIDSKAKFKTNVGFNYIIEDTRQEPKKRMLAGEFGKLKRIRFYAIWPRDFAYFHRNNWAGLLKQNGRYVLDSCMGNASAHYSHNVLFWAGTKALFDWADIAEVEAELYRAHKIEAADTFFVKAITSNKIELTLVYTHACSGNESQLEIVECENARIEYDTQAGYKIIFADGKVEEKSFRRVNLIEDNLGAYIDYVEGRTDRPITTLEDSRPFVNLCDLVYVASGKINQIPEKYIDYSVEGSLDVIDIKEAAHKFISEGLFPSQQNTPWSKPGGKAKIGDLAKFEDIIDREYKKLT